MRLGAGNTLATLGWGYLVTTHYTQTGLVDVADLSAIASLWGQPAPAGYDLNGDGFITIADIQMVAALWGTSCP